MRKVGNCLNQDLQDCSGSQQARFGNLANELSGDREGGEGWRESMEERKREGWKVGRSRKVSVKQGRGEDSQSMLLGSLLWKKTAIL